MTFKCKMCGGDLVIEAESTVCECEYCGTKQTIPNADNEKKTNLFNRANRLRMNSEFDKASAVYESLVAEFPEEAEAYWGLCLCAYGIEYVDDPATGKKIPTCHRTLPTSIMEDANFEQACDYADTIARRIYRDEAKAIDRIQKDILSIAASEAPYDVFICYKETAEDGGRTEDSVLAQDIYDALTAKGMKVFFSRITLEDKLGVQYEPYIFAALSSAKVMLAIGTAFEYYDAVWVKNEWSRFLSMMKTDKTKTLIPCFKGLDAYDMPKEFKGLQAQDMGKLGWLQDLVRGVEKLCGKGGAAATAQPVVQQTVVREVVQSSTAENLMKRVYLFLEDGDFKQASEYIDKVLDADAEYAPAYVGKVLVQYKLRDEKALANLRETIDGNAEWQKAMRFADAQQKQTYTAYAKAINDNAEKQAKEDKYNVAVAAMNSRVWYTAIVAFRALGEYKESKAQLQKCIDAYRQQLAAKEAAAGKIDPALAAAKEKVAQVRRTLERGYAAINYAEKGKTEVEKREQTIPEEIHRLSNELSQVRGLFSGGKKRELEGKIDELKRELTSVTQRKQDYEQTISKVKAEVTAAEAALSEAKAAQERIDAELQKKELTRWTDEAIIAAAAAAAREPFTKVGNIVTYGHYEQDNNTSNGKEAVEWLVLDVQGDKVLLVSRYALDCKPYNTTETSVTWETCSLRTWLNETFINKAFSPAEQGAIVMATVDNSKSQGNSEWSINGGNNTQDKIFLLSYAEAWKYFKNNDARKCQSTKYAVAQNAYTASNGNCWWWLRSPGFSSSSAAKVSTNGVRINDHVNYAGAAVRPAFWLDLSSYIF